LFRQLFTLELDRLRLNRAEHRNGLIAAVLPALLGLLRRRFVVVLRLDFCEIVVK
jgi:hypothetical protein